ncbi:kinase-like domain-containing protein [Mycena sp. CBHHK59/15]|nr:kinase-like domain-containing protein [Mycena sp. CBHHK59/15]
MQVLTQTLTISTIFDATSPTRKHSRSPLSPIAPPNRFAPHKKSIRQVALENKQRLANTGGNNIVIGDLTLRRRGVKLWGHRMEEPPSPRNDKPVRGFSWIRGQPIGRGAHGRVYLGLNATTGEMIAVKQIDISRRGGAAKAGVDSHSLRCLERDMESMKAVRHSNLIEYFGLEEGIDGIVSIFMEYEPGTSIRALVLKHGKFDADTVKSFTSQVLDGLAYLHSGGLLHGGLKSTNILVGVSGVCKIEGLGCPEGCSPCNLWTAPEIIKTKYKAYDAKVDIWSTGCVVLEMWDGRRPWFGLEAVAVMYKLHCETLRPPVSADLGLTSVAEDFMEKCLAINPADRMRATELRRHPYLDLSPDWVFQGF